MDVAAILSVIGSLAIIALGINAFFLKGIFGDLNAVKLQLATLIANDKHKEEKIQELEIALHRHEEESSRLRSSVHELRNEITKINLRMEK